MKYACNIANYALGSRKYWPVRCDEYLRNGPTPTHATRRERWEWSSCRRSRNGSGSVGSTPNAVSRPFGRRGARDGGERTCRVTELPLRGSGDTWSSLFRSPRSCAIPPGFPLSATIVHSPRLRNSEVHLCTSLLSTLARGESLTDVRSLDPTLLTGGLRAD